MLKYTVKKCPKTGNEWIETHLKGKEILSTPLLNKGTAFSMEEREALGILGKLPYHVESLDEQVNRATYQYNRYISALQKYIYLSSLHDKNEILFYKLLSENLDEMLPMIYTPGVGSAVKQFSREFRGPRGLYISYPDQANLAKILDNRTHKDIEVIVITDGEGVLGIGDQGIGAMDIPIAKLVVYSLCGMDPYKTLPIMLDVGTDNAELLDDPLYLGWPKARLRGQEYDNFIDNLMSVLHEKFPKALIHWEDFGKVNAYKILNKYRHQHLMFNDDMQGTGVVSLAALLAAVRASNITLENHRVLVYGAGTAGVGISEQFYSAMVRSGISEAQARDQFWMIDRSGLLFSDSNDLADFQKPFARDVSQKELYRPENPTSLLDIVAKVKPTILIGCSTVRGAFSEQVVSKMMEHCAMPIIFPLSNPTDNAEATPEQLVAWTKGNALIATGSPFEPVEYNNKRYEIAQCNNALAFPGLGMGALAVNAKEITDNMLYAASQAICSQAPVHQNNDLPILPNIVTTPSLSIQVAIKVAEQAIEDGVATNELVTSKSCTELVQDLIWKPYYKQIKAV